MTTTAGVVYDLEGTLLEGCSCLSVCPCWVGEDPDEGRCASFNAYHFDRGTIGGVDVSGLSFIDVCAARIDASREDLIADFRELSTDRFDERALQLALVGALLQLGWRRALGAAQAPDQAERMATRAELRWWYQRARPLVAHGALAPRQSPRLAGGPRLTMSDEEEATRSR